MQNTSNDVYEIYSTYEDKEKGKIAHVLRHKINESWGVYMMNDGKPGLIEYYPVKSEVWCENVAENFVLVIRNI